MKEGNLIIKVTCVYCRPVLPSKQGCLVLVLLKHKRATIMKMLKGLIPSIQISSIQMDLLAVLTGALLVALAIGTIMVMVVSRF
jgi:hypothetical protein